MSVIYHQLPQHREVTEDQRGEVACPGLYTQGGPVAAPRLPHGTMAPKTLDELAGPLVAQDLATSTVASAPAVLHL